MSFNNNLIMNLYIWIINLNSKNWIKWINKYKTKNVLFIQRQMKFHKKQYKVLLLRTGNRNINMIVYNLEKNLF